MFRDHSFCMHLEWLFALRFIGVHGAVMFFIGKLYTLIVTEFNEFSFDHMCI